MSIVMKRKKWISVCVFGLMLVIGSFVHAVSIGDLQYSSRQGDHFDSVFSFLTECSQETTSYCEQFSYKLDFFNPMNGVTGITQPEGKFSICSDDSYPTQLMTFHQFTEVPQYGLFAQQKVNISGSALVDSWLGTQYTASSNNCHIYCNGSVSITGTASINGNVYCNDVSTASGIDLNGEIFGLQTPLDWFNLAIDQGFELANTVGTTGWSDQNKIVLTEGIYIIPELSLEQGQSLTITGKVIIFCEGDIVLRADSFINTQEKVHDLVLYSHYGSVYISDEARLSGQVFALNGHILVEQDAVVFGSMVAGQITLQDKAALHFNEDKFNQSLSFARLRVTDSSKTETTRTVVFSEHQNSCMGTRKLDVEDGKFVWRTSLAGKNNVIKNTSKSIENLRGYSEYSMLIEHRLMERIVFYVNPYYWTNLSEAILRYNDGQGYGYCNFVRHWAYHWSVFNEDMNGIDHEDYSNNKYTHQPFKHTGTRTVGNDEYQKYCPGSISLRLPDYHASDHEYYNNYLLRLRRLAIDMADYGNVIQLDLFEHSMIGEWEKNPYNPNNQQGYPSVPPYPICVNSFTSNDCVKDFIRCSNSYYPDLFNQQKYFIDRIVSFCENSGFTNVYFDIINEGHNYDSNVHVWYDAMIAEVKNTNGDALVSINSMPDPQLNLDTPEEFRDNFENLYDGLSSTSRSNISIVSYHFPYWFDEDTALDDLDDLFSFHLTNIGFGKAIMVDDDGDFTETYRSDNDRVADWSDKCTFDNEYNFNHKDYQRFTSWGFIYDPDALYAVGTGQHP